MSFFGIIAQGGNHPVIVDVYKSISNYYVDIEFNYGVYGAADRATAVTTSNFTITNFTAGGVTNVAIASVKRNTHYTSASALNLIGGETVVRIFLTLTGTPDSTESFQIQCTNLYSGNRGKSSPLTSLINLNITPFMLFDYQETGSVTTLSLGVQEVSDMMPASNDLVQTTDGARPIDAGGKIGFNSTIGHYLDGGDVGALDFQKGNNFTIVIKNIESLNSGTTGWIIANRGAPGTNNGWSISVGTSNSLFFVLHDGTSQGVAEVASFTPSSPTTLFFVNSGGNLTIYDDAGNSLATGDATAIAAIVYTGIELYVGRRESSATSYYNGYWDKIGIFTSALTTAQQAKVVENL